MHSDVISHLLADHVSHAGECSAWVTESAMDTNGDIRNGRIQGCGQIPQIELS